jgi:hypothetical protein
MTSIDFNPGDRVQLNKLGISRSPKTKVRTGVVAMPMLAGSATISILFDGNKRPTRVHCSYVDIDDTAK